jgi:hypothetical protein cdiviTM7_01565
MAGTKLGGLKARDTNLKNNPDFYREIGKLGGQKCVMKGFALNPKLARQAGAKGGRSSRRGINKDVHKSNS